LAQALPALIAGFAITISVSFPLILASITVGATAIFFTWAYKE
jgi:hypothetical protein